MFFRKGSSPDWTASRKVSAAIEEKAYVSAFKWCSATYLSFDLDSVRIHIYIYICWLRCFSLDGCPDFNFSVNCGGPDIRSSNGVLYEKDEGELGPASAFVSRTQRWAVSNVGLFTGSNSNQYRALSDTPFANTSDSEIFQSARLSASSLRYYGLGLENGGYSVTLQFGEIQIQGSDTWTSLGRRLFDIYVQVSTIY